MKDGECFFGHQYGKPIFKMKTVPFIQKVDTIQLCEVLKFNHLKIFQSLL